MKPNENQKPVPEPSPSIVTSSQPPTTDTTIQPSSIAPTPVNTPPTQSHKKALVALVVVLVVVLIGGGAFALYHHNHKAKLVMSSSTSKTTSKTQSPASSTNSTNNGLLTYVSTNDSNLIVTNNNQKVLAKITNPSGNTEFNVLSNNGQAALIRAETSSGNNETEYLVNNKGNVTKLPTSVSKPNVTGTSGYNQFLGYNNDYIESSCTGEILTCNVNNVNLTTGAVTVVTSLTNSTPTEDPPLSILGVSPSNVAYILSDGGNAGGTEKASLEEVNIASKKIVKTMSLPDLLSPTNDQPYQAIANNFSNLAYVGTAKNNSQIDITNLDSGTTSIINDQCSGLGAMVNGIYWSPDNSKIAYDCDEPNTTFVAYIDVANGNVTKLKNMSISSPKSSLNDEGWSSNNTVNYYYSPSRSFVPSSWTYYSVNTTSGKVTTNPTPKGYWLMTPLFF